MAGTLTGVGRLVMGGITEHSNSITQKAARSWAAVIYRGLPKRNVSVASDIKGSTSLTFI